MTSPSRPDDAEVGTAGSRRLIGFALALIIWTLGWSAGRGLGPFFDRAHAPPDASRPELELLACIEHAVTSMTEPGQAVRLRVGGDVYLHQRVTEIVHPRLDLVSHSSAPELVVVTTPEPSSGTRCGPLDVSVVGL